MLGLEITTKAELGFLKRVGMVVMCSMGNGFGTNRIPCINPKIASFLMKDLDAVSLGDLIFSTPSGDGNLRIAICPGDFFFFFLLPPPTKIFSAQKMWESEGNKKRCFFSIFFIVYVVCY